jgi:glycosyltransferase involved in cell wall biosynthesis
VKLLFVKNSLAWPRVSGHDVHTYYMMRSLAALNVVVYFATISPVSPSAAHGLQLRGSYVLSEERLGPSVTLNGIRGQFASYFGADAATLGAAATVIQQVRPDAVVVVGLEMLPFLTVVPQGITRVWYAADEWVWHHLSRIRADRGHRLRHLRQAALKGAYERAFAGVVDRVWMVSESERRAARWFAGMKRVDVLPNGVDATFFSPGPPADIPQSLVFWGRLDFGPNVEALRWLLREIWPGLIRRFPDAQLSVIGFAPGGEVRDMAVTAGVRLYADVDDLRPIIARHTVAALPFVSGSGIKNKLLEAAALAKPIVCTRHACNGIRAAHAAPLCVADTPAAWLTSLERLWRSPSDAVEIGTQTRAWVVENHGWERTAGAAVAALTAEQRSHRTRATGEPTTA